MESKSNQKIGVLSGIVGIFANIFLCICKMTVGLIFNLISVTADGINNLADSGSSIISIIGYKAAGKPADKKHPFGHARIEYLLSLIIGISVIIVGVQLAISSVQKIISPTQSPFHYAIIIALSISILVKVFLGLFNYKLFKKTQSLPLKATSIDSINDIIATSMILIAYLISDATSFNLDGYVGVIVSIVIAISGIKIITQSLSPLLGEKPCDELINTIYSKILNYEGVLGLHDLTVHNYGPNRNFASVHVEIDSEKNILDSHDLIDTIECDFRKMDINLVIHMDPIVINNPVVTKLKEQIITIINDIDPLLSMHDFRVAMGTTHSNLIFDVVIPCDFRLTNEQIGNAINEKVVKINSTYRTVINYDKNYI